jgi:hypothetical protein
MAKCLITTVFDVSQPGHLPALLKICVAVIETYIMTYVMSTLCLYTLHQFSI